MVINISIADKRPVVEGTPIIVCNNEGSYIIQFTFDSEWDGYDTKVVRFTWVKKGEVKFHDVEMTGTQCVVPALSDTTRVKVGVFTGDICTTVPAFIPCERSILCDDGVTSVENDKYYANAAREAADRAEAAAASVEDVVEGLVRAEVCDGVLIFTSGASVTGETLVIPVA